MRLVGPLAIALSACTVGTGPEPETDAGPAEVDAQGWDGVAPPGVIDGELAGGDETVIDVADGDTAIVRFEAVPGEHLGFRLDFVGDQDPVLAIDRWDGAAPVFLGETDAGPGLRVLAVLDQDGPRTFWVRLAGPVTGTLSAVRTPFAEGTRCEADCAHLLQLPLPNDVTRDGYDPSHAVFRYQFGRRDLLMFLRAAGRTMADAGHAPFQPEDLSQWDGETPGTDTGSPRHASHQRGKDVDLSLYGTDGGAQWRSFCTAQSTADGRVCVDGTLSPLFDGVTVSQMVGVFAETGRMTMGFMDRELIPALDPGQPLLQHWPNHDNHVHVRVSEVEGDAVAAPGPIEAP